MHDIRNIYSEPVCLSESPWLDYYQPLLSRVCQARCAEYNSRNVLHASCRTEKQLTRKQDRGHNMKKGSLISRNKIYCLCRASASSLNFILLWMWRLLRQDCFNVGSYSWSAGNVTLLSFVQTVTIKNSIL